MRTSTDPLAPQDYETLPVRTTRRLARRQRLFDEGERVAVLTRIERGRVLLSQTMPDGRRHIVDIAGPGDLFGHENPEHLHVYSAETLTAVQVALIDVDVAGSPAGVRAIGHDLRRKNDRLRAHGRHLARRRGIERVAAFVLSLVDAFEAPACVEGLMCAVPLTRQEIAEYLGLTQETVSRAFSELDRRGLIENTGRGRVALREPSELWRVALMAEAEPEAVV
ncbi:MAG: Crp/Fnr family transcriptional regulator [Pseudomonadota bacterium]